MTKLPLAGAIFFFLIISGDAFNSGETLAVTTASSAAICGLTTQPSQTLACHVTTISGDRTIPVFANVTFSSISGGASSLCGLRSGGATVVCFDGIFAGNLTPHRLYFNSSALLRQISAGESHICGILAAKSTAVCWRFDRYIEFSLPSESERFSRISSGSGFTCGLLESTNRVRCWGFGSIPARIESGFGNISMATIVCGGSHACGVSSAGVLMCRGNNESGQLNSPIESSEFEFSQVSLGLNHGCAIRAANGSVICWGSDGRFSSSLAPIVNVSFELLVSGSGFSCGLTTLNFSVVCWGPRWLRNSSVPVALPEILPGPCVAESSCGNCSTYPLSSRLCSGEGRRICKPCFNRIPIGNGGEGGGGGEELEPNSSPTERHSKELKRGLLAFAIVGSVGGLAGIITAGYCLYSGVCFGKKKIHNSVQPTITRGGSSNNGGAGAGAGGGTNSNSPASSLSNFRRNGSRIMRRQRSGTSSKHADRAEEFTLSELADATDGFSPENCLGSGSFGVVYKGKLSDGRHVAIKRGETKNLAAAKKKYHQEKESAFESELSFLSRLHHKHLVRLVGFCDEKDERLLVYEFMKNGSLYDRLHGKSNLEKSSDPIVNQWKTRIKIALDAARGIEYLHTYAVPPIIHRDIKSSNILLDAVWTAKVSDFGLSMMGPDDSGPVNQSQPAKAAGTVGYIDPEYYGLNVLTAKSDVYGLGVVLLELITGKRAIFKAQEGDGNNGSVATSVVEYAVPAIMAGEVSRVLDPRPGPPELNEGEAVELVAYTAMHCVNLEGRERPTMTDIVANLERALSLCDDSHGSISSGILSIVSE